MVAVEEKGGDLRAKRVHFKWTRRFLSIPILELDYSLRCQFRRSGPSDFYIQFDEAKGDLPFVKTTIAFMQRNDNQTEMTYHSILASPSLWQRPWVHLFGKMELEQHILAFEDYVLRTQGFNIMSAQAAS